MFSFREWLQGRFRFSIRVTVVGMFLLMTTLTAMVGVSLQYYFSTRTATSTALSVYRETASSISDYLSSIDKRAGEVTRLLASYPDLVDKGRINPSSYRLFAETLRSNPIFYAIYIGTDDDEFYEVVNLNASSMVRRQLKALPQDRWMTIRVSGKGEKRRREYRYYDKSFKLRATRSTPSDYHPRVRPWYSNARTGTVNRTEPYLFQHLQAPGETYSTRIDGHGAVLAVDIALSSLSDKLSGYGINKESNIYLYQKSGEIIASNKSSLPPVKVPHSKPLSLSPELKKVVEKYPVLKVSNEMDWPPFDFMVSGKPYGYSIDVLNEIERMTGLKFRYVNGVSWPELKQMFQDGELDIIHPVVGTPESAQLGAMSKPMINISYGVLTKKYSDVVTNIRQLEGKRVAIPRGWSIIATIRQHFPKITILEVNGVKGMFDAVREGRAAAGIDTASFLRYTAREFFLTDVEVYTPLDFDGVKVASGLHYIVDPNKAEVVKLINLALDNLTIEQKEALKSRWLINQWSNHRSTSTVPNAELLNLAKDESGLDTLHQVNMNGEESLVFIKAVGDGINASDYFAVVTPVQTVMEPVYNKVKLSLVITAAAFLVLIPLAIWLASSIVNPIKQLSLENEKIRKRRYRDLVAVDSRIVEIDELAGSMMKMAKAIERHAREQEALMDSFIELIAQAIDDKSPYTAGHCARVPELALMLVEEAELSKQPPFADFGFSDETEWREFRIGAWLHDCGKITTPEHIVDKGSKLETIYNRIHEVRMRFEVLWRDAEIDYWERRFNSPEEASQLLDELEQKRRMLQESFAFVASCNEGSEFMAEEDKERLENLAEITWQRHFDIRLGLSRPERERFDDKPEVLPVTEKLLQDKPWHVIDRNHNQQYDERLGIKMEVPKHLYNQGELYNLKISYGTLTDEDRFRINEHIISTIRMLDKLPLTSELERVPRYASTHHERMDGKGYPRRLDGSQLSIPERIMALADVFEALTAADRPYKPPKTVSVAVDILHKMVLDEHIDRDVFELFLKSEVFKKYAARYLPAEQNDEVDISRYF